MPSLTMGAASHCLRVISWVLSYLVRGLWWWARAPQAPQPEMTSLCLTSEGKTQDGVLPSAI